MASSRRSSSGGGVRRAQAGGGVQDAVAQRLGLGFGEVAVQGEELEPGEQDCAVIAAVSHAWLSV